MSVSLGNAELEHEMERSNQPRETIDQVPNDTDARAREIAVRYGLPEDKVRDLLDQHADEGGLSEALTNLAHFLRAPS